MRRIPPGLAVFVLLLAVPAGAGSLAFHPGLVDFGNVPIAGPAVQLFARVVNHGSPTTITGFANGTNCGEFTISADNLPVTLGDLDTLQFQVGYHPINRGPDACAFTLRDDNGVTDVFGATGVGTAPQLAVDDTLLQFSDQTWGSGVPDTLYVGIGNQGNEPIAAPHLTIHFQYGLDYSIAPVPLPIPGGGIDYVPVRFFPIAAGTRNDWMTISLDNDPKNEPNAIVHLQGTWAGGPTGVGERPLGESRLRVEPTPTPGTVRFTCSAPRAGRVRVEVRDLAGRRVARIERFATAPGALALTLRRDLDWSPAPGVYLVRVLLEGESIGRGRVVVLR